MIPEEGGHWKLAMIPLVTYTKASLGRHWIPEALVEAPSGVLCWPETDPLEFTSEVWIPLVMADITIDFMGFNGDL